MSSSVSDLSEKHSISENETGYLPHVLLVGGAITLLVIGILATVGIMNSMGSAPASYLSYGAYGGAALFTLAEISFIAIKYCNRSSQKTVESVPESKQVTETSVLTASTPTKKDTKTSVLPANAHTEKGSAMARYERHLTLREVNLLKQSVMLDGAKFFNHLKPNPYQTNEASIDASTFVKLVCTILDGNDEELGLRDHILANHPPTYRKMIQEKISKGESYHVHTACVERRIEYRFSTKEMESLLDFLEQVFADLPE